MSLVLSGWRKWLVVLLGCPLVGLAAYFGYLKLVPIDEYVTTGSAYGFTIGQSKVEAYQVARSLFESGEIVGINTRLSREEELRLHPEAQKRFAVAEVRPVFDRWTDWILSLEYDGIDRLATVKFTGDIVSGVGYPGDLSNRWSPPGVGDALSIAVGHGYEEVYGTLESLSLLPGYESLMIETHWLARRQPVSFADSELRFVEPYDKWWLMADTLESYFDTIDLVFVDGALTTIHRYRHYERP